MTPTVLIDNWNKRPEPKVRGLTSEGLKQRCDEMIYALVGADHYESWWNGPNKAFKGETPLSVFQTNQKDVYDYLMKMYD